MKNKRDWFSIAFLTYAHGDISPGYLAHVFLKVDVYAVYDLIKKRLGENPQTEEAVKNYKWETEESIKDILRARKRLYNRLWAREKRRKGHEDTT